MVALFRSIENGEPRAVSCTYLNPQAQKTERRFHGPVAGAAVMLDPFDEVTTDSFPKGLSPAWRPDRSAFAHVGRSARPAPWAIFPCSPGSKRFPFSAEH